MTTSRGFSTNEYYDGMSFHNLDEIERQPRRLTQIRLTSDPEDHQSPRLRSDEGAYQNPRLRSDQREYQNTQLRSDQGDYQSPRLRSYHEEYRNPPTRKDDRPQAHNSKQSRCCSKQCLIGLCIGLLIGMALVVAIAVPIGVTKTCPTDQPTISATTNCPSTTTSSPRSCIGQIYSTPNWTGTFLMDDGCIMTSCCCLFSQIIVNQTAGNVMQITGSVSGQCTNVGTTVFLTISPMPTTFQANFFWGTAPIRLQLGRDNSYLSFVNIGNAFCSATALRRS